MIFHTGVCLRWVTYECTYGRTHGRMCEYVRFDLRANVRPWMVTFYATYHNVLHWLHTQCTLTSHYQGYTGMLHRQMFLCCCTVESSVPEDTEQYFSMSCTHFTAQHKTLHVLYFIAVPPLITYIRTTEYMLIHKCCAHTYSM